MDWAIVREEKVRDAGQALYRVLVVVGDGLVGLIAAGQHEGQAGEVVQDQVVQGRVGQHDAKVWVAGRHLGGHAGVGPAAQQHDGTGRRLQQGALVFGDFAERAGSRQVGHHQRKGFVVALLAAAQPGHGLLIAGGTGEVVAAQALDGAD